METFAMAVGVLDALKNSGQIKFYTNNVFFCIYKRGLDDYTYMRQGALVVRRFNEDLRCPYDKLRAGLPIQRVGWAYSPTICLGSRSPPNGGRVRRPYFQAQEALGTSDLPLI